jgi:diguanylate cyclase (GGDEF)-like protein
MSTVGLNDEVTGLPGRRGFLAGLRRQITHANDHKTSLALLIVDINGFSAINAASGYDFGDQVLRHVATQLHEVARSHDYSARIGDNRFALLLPRVMNRGHAELAIQKLLRLLDVPFESAGTRLKVAVTVGAALCPMHSSHPEYLLREAESCIRRARAAGVHFMFPERHGAGESISELWDIEIGLQGAIARGEMAMHYQPKVRCSDGRPVGAEALMRWHSRSRGEVLPEIFIPVAEQTGQIKPLTIWALNTALRQASEWSQGWGRISVAVNVPAELVKQHDLPELVENALRLWANRNVELVLEITERSLVASPQHSFRILSAVRELGVKVSIDDFGTGYSCLAYFRDIPADELKIDKSFVSGLNKDPACADIANLIIDLAHKFDLAVVAEGVEDEAALRFLQQHGCDVAQGHLFAPAMPRNQFEKWLSGFQRENGGAHG